MTPPSENDQKIGSDVLDSAGDDVANAYEFASDDHLGDDHRVDGQSAADDKRGFRFTGIVIFLLCVLLGLSTVEHIRSFMAQRVQSPASDDKVPVRRPPLMIAHQAAEPAVSPAFSHTSSTNPASNPADASYGSHRPESADHPVNSTVKSVSSGSVTQTPTVPNPESTIHQPVIVDSNRPPALLDSKQGFSTSPQTPAATEQNIVGQIDPTEAPLAGPVASRTERFSHNTNPPATNSLRADQTPVGSPNSANPVGESSVPNAGSEVNEVLVQNESSAPIRDVATNAVEIDEITTNQPTTETPLPSPAPKVDEPRTVKVHDGDSFIKLSEKFYHTSQLAQALFHYNRKRVIHPDGLVAGQLVEIPTQSDLELHFRKSQLAETQLTKEPTNAAIVEAAPIETARFEATPFETARNDTVKKTHKIRAGESLIDIARLRLGSANRWPEIYRLNRKMLGDTFDSLPEGHKLNLPPDSIMTRRDHSELK